MRFGTLAAGITVGAAMLCAAMAVRYLMIEPRDVGAACQAGLGPWWCPMRQALVALFLNNVIGLAALVLAVLAHVVSGRSTLAHASAVVAVGLGAVGLVLYNAGLGAPAFLLGLMRVVRLDRMVRTEPPAAP